jgi:hypothetical protein
MSCKYCGIASNEHLKLDSKGNEFHQSCEDDFEYSFSEWDLYTHGLPWDGSDVDVDGCRGDDHGAQVKAAK